MKIGFFGTPEIATYCLNDLSRKHEIVFAVTPEDRPYGRHLKLRPCEVKQAAAELNIPVMQPSKLNESIFLEKIRDYAADIFVVVAYGKIIPEEVYNLPPLKTINLHPSLLPLYRGAAPMQWSIINGDNETGVSVQLINERLDAGDIVLQEKIHLDINSTYSDLYTRVLPLGSEMLEKTIGILSSGKPELIKQNEGNATYCKKIDRTTANINWTSNSLEIHNLVRGLNPKPVAWTTFRGKNIKIWQTCISDITEIDLEPGEVARFQKKRLLAGTSDGILEIISLQPETKKIMDAAAFINGHRLEKGEKFK